MSLDRPERSDGGVTELTLEPRHRSTKDELGRCFSLFGRNDRIGIALTVTTTEAMDSLSECDTLLPTVRLISRTSPNVSPRDLSRD
jgi:hypothetical protein